jgi:hypothetical protein
VSVLQFAIRDIKNHIIEQESFINGLKEQVFVLPPPSRPALRPVLPPPSSRQSPSDMQSEPSLRITSKSSKNSKNSTSSNKSSGEYDSDSNNDFRVLNKITKLLETDNPSPIIEKIKSISYIHKILTSMEHSLLFLSDDKREREKRVVEELKYRISKENREELKRLKTKLKRLETKLEKLLANEPLYIRKFMEENGKNTIAKLENAKRILEVNPLNLKDLEYTIRDIKAYIIEQQSIINGLKEQVCSRILTPKQVGPICWFMSIFVAMFYSQRNRKVILKASKHWDTKDELFTLLNRVLDEKYLMSENEKEYYEKFSDNTFGDILRLLFKKDSKSFPYNPELKDGFVSEVYICKLYNLLGVDCEMFDYNGSALLTYSYLNKEYDVMDYIFGDETKHRAIKKEYEKSKTGYVIDLKDTYYTKNKSTPSTPTILILRVVNLDYIISGNQILDGGMYKELTSMRDEIKYNGKTYILDSVILSDNKLKHSITGITCKGIKYIYNGWTKKSNNPVMPSQEITREIPCGLQRHDWTVKGQGDDFCLNTKTCLPDILSKDKLANESRLCFNFSEGERLLIYVLKDKHLEKLNKAVATATTTLYATIRRSVAQKAHLERLRKTEALQAIIRRRSSV